MESIYTVWYTLTMKSLKPLVTIKLFTIDIAFMKQVSRGITQKIGFYKSRRENKNQSVGKSKNAILNSKNWASTE